MLRKKEEEKILLDLKIVIKERLLTDFKNRKGRLVDSVESIQIHDIKIDEDNDNRDKIIILNIEAAARVFVIFNNDSKSSDNIALRNQKPIEFIYNKEIGNFEIDEKTAIFFDNTTH
jgi:hypothetical protein